MMPIISQSQLEFTQSIILKANKLTSILMTEVNSDVSKVCHWINENWPFMTEKFQSPTQEFIVLKKNNYQIPCNLILYNDMRIYLDTKTKMPQDDYLFIDYHKGILTSQKTAENDSFTPSDLSAESRVDRITSLFKNIIYTKMFRTLIALYGNQYERPDFYKKSVTKLPYSFLLDRSGACFISTNWQIASGYYKQVSLGIDVKKEVLVAHSREYFYDFKHCQRGLSELQISLKFKLFPSFSEVFGFILKTHKNSKYCLHIFQEFFSLRSVEHHQTYNNSFSSQEILKIAFDSLFALSQLHRKFLCHRDIKPANIVIKDTKSGGLEAAVIDFGLSYQIKSNQKIEGGSYYYAPPEIINNESICDSTDLLKYDIFSLGISLYQLYFETDPPWWNEVQNRKDTNDQSKVDRYWEVMKKTTSFCDECLKDPVLKLINRMLEYDYKKRPTADDLITEWL